MTAFMGLRHVGLGGKDLATLAEFYRDVMGLKVTRQNPVDAPYGASLFLSGHPDEEDHDLVFFENPALAHVAFRVASLQELKAWYRRIKERGVPIKFAFNHGTELSFYIDDPEANMIEIYWPTHIDIRQGLADPIDLDLPDDELLREVERATGQIVPYGGAASS